MEDGGRAATKTVDHQHNQVTFKHTFNIQFKIMSKDKKYLSIRSGDNGRPRS